MASISIMVRALTLFVLASLVSTNTPLPGRIVEASMASNDSRGLEMAMASRPMWHFAEMRPAFFSPKKKTCYPTSALTDSGLQHGNKPGKWPNANPGCPDPGPKGQGNPFPTYWSVKQCSLDEIRVTYSLYFQHDGFSNVLVAAGHMNDWERVVVIWKRNQTSGDWYRNSLLKSMHSGYQAKSWNKVESTFTFDNPNEKRGKNKDGVKIYVGWAKHPNFDTMETRWRDTVSQGCQREYRSNDWWFLPTDKEMIWAAKESPEGKKMATFNWGSATGGPWVSEDTICSKKSGGFVKC